MLRIVLTLDHLECSSFLNLIFSDILKMVFEYIIYNPDSAILWIFQWYSFVLRTDLN